MCKNVADQVEISLELSAFFTTPTQTVKEMTSSSCQIEITLKAGKMRTSMLSTLSLSTARSPSCVAGRCNLTSWVNNLMKANVRGCVIIALNSCIFTRRTGLRKLEYYWSLFRQQIYIRCASMPLKS